MFEGILILIGLEYCRGLNRGKKNKETSLKFINKKYFINQILAAFKVSSREKYENSNKISVVGFKIDNNPDVLEER